MKIRACLVAVALLSLMLSLQGCFLFVVGAAAGAGAGAVSYSNNELRTTQEVTMNQAWDACLDGLRDLEYSVIKGESHKDATGGILMARNAKDQPVRVQLIRQTDRLTEIHVRVGTFDTAANKAAAQLLYEKIKARL